CEFKLIQIIKELLHSPELIIMDEPDVFLDFENLNSLKKLINGHNGMLLVITHNRFLLNNCFNKIIHLENKQLQEFLGNYTEYNFYLLGSKVETQELAIADEEEIERNDNLIDKLRFIASYNPEAARGRALNARVKIQERLEERKIQMPFVNIKRPKIEIETDKILDEDFILKVDGLTLGFNSELIKAASFEIKPGEKVAVIGGNGTGKTTLLREINKNHSPNITISENAHIAYVSQSQNESLNENNTILNEFFEIGFKKNSEIYSYLENYNFTENKINKLISTLSGGEKNTLQIAKVAASNANLLILDEPSSHLDTYAQVELEKALKNYNGAILMVSHDYYTVINTADYILTIENQEIRKMSMRKFRKMIYNNYFNKDYLLIEDKKKEIELRVEEALKEHNFTLAKDLLDPLEELTAKLTNLK
ncbi:MAG: ATP-binding cassette domain-containing protein, partial [Bacilli bacterium]